MADKRFHLGWFMNFTTNEWNTAYAHAHLRDTLREF
jgi:hypothetical protein